MILIMDEGEILREYRGAKKKTEQVRIHIHRKGVSMTLHIDANVLESIDSDDRR